VICQLPKKFTKLQKEPLSKSLLFLTWQIKKRRPTRLFSPRTFCWHDLLARLLAAAAASQVAAASLFLPAGHLFLPVGPVLQAAGHLLQAGALLVFQIGQQIFPASCKNLKVFLIHQPPARNHAFQEIPSTERIG